MKATLGEAIPEAKRQPAVYVLLGFDGTYLYKGSCRDLQERLKDHQAGRASRTKNRRPLSLVYLEYVATYSEALTRERFLKTGKGRVWLHEQTRAAP
jgi:putative endonuclease